MVTQKGKGKQGFGSPDWKAKKGRKSTLNSAMTRNSCNPPQKDFIMNTVSYSGILPQFHLDHILRLTDDTGIVQHAIYSIPNYHEGYCLDDNARALLMSTMVYQKSKDKIALRLISRY